MQSLLLQLQSLSTKPGIYLFLNEKGKILYVGKSKNLKKRVASYLTKYVELGTKTQALVSQIKQIKSIIVPSEIEALLLEIKYIKKHKPKYNIRFTDGKNYPLIRITVKDKYPKILIARRNLDKSSEYFGPFPNATAMRLVLRTIRRIFPYQSVPNHAKRMCLYYHLGLCPCPPVFASNNFNKEYRKTIKHIINFLNGNTKKIIKDLTKERIALSKNENFEKAAEIQNRIIAIKLITGPFYKSKFDSNIDPNLNEDLLNNQLSSLRYFLSQNGVYVKKLKKIECYDISNTSGTNATGSLVVFTNGEKDTKWYRRFKIKMNNGPNDVAMMLEVLERRLKHKEWPMPDLIIVDGGKGQVGAAAKILSLSKDSSVDIPLIGLAKKAETIVTSDLKEISLPKSSIALKLVMRIRDEAHRFAITYHRKLRSKTFLL